MAKEAIIKLSLVEESCLKKNGEIADEIFKEIVNGAVSIPWCGKVNLVAVLNKNASSEFRTEKIRP